MSIKQIAGTITVLVVSMLSAAAIAGDDDGLATVLRQVVERNLAAFNQEDKLEISRRITRNTESW